MVYNGRQWYTVQEVCRGSRLAGFSLSTPDAKLLNVIDKSAFTDISVRMYVRNCSLQAHSCV